MYYSINISRPDCSLVFWGLGLPSSWGSQFMGGSPQPKNLHDRKCSASFPISESDTLPLRRCPSVSLIKDNCPQTMIFTGPKTQMWHALSIFRTWPLSLLPATQPWGCLLPISTCRSSLPDWTPLITCQLDWLQVFIICDDWADLEANLNQGCWRTGEHRCSSSRPGLRFSPGSLVHWLHVTVRSLCKHAKFSSRRSSRVWKKGSFPPSTMVGH